MNATTIDPTLLAGNRKPLAGYQATHFLWQVKDRVATITLNRPDRKNPLTFDSYAELRDLFHALKWADDVKAVVVHGAGGNFCSGGDVHEIIGPLVALKAPELLMFTRMTGELVKNMRARSPSWQPWTVSVQVPAPLWPCRPTAAGHRAQQDRFCLIVGLAGCDMGACAILPRIIGQGRASDLLYTAAVWAVKKVSAGVSSTGCVHQKTCWRKRRPWPPTWPPVRALPMASPRPCCTRNGP